MLVTTVTLTGADDSVAASDLFALSSEFPFVEWGILVSETRQGEPRYPSMNRLAALVTHLPARVRLSAHLCGETARNMLEGRSMLNWSWLGFRRIQINGFSNYAHDLKALEHIEQICQDNTGQGVILQVANTAAALLAADRLANTQPNIEALYDLSGGQGIKLVNPPMPTARLRLGYAGGLGPGNVRETIRHMSTLGDGTTWIDMESSLRSNDDRCFDLQICRKVLKEARKAFDEFFGDDVLNP